MITHFFKEVSHGLSSNSKKRLKDLFHYFIKQDKKTTFKLPNSEFLEASSDLLNNAEVVQNKTASKLCPKVTFYIVTKP